MGKCVYCKSQLPDGQALDVCERCGIKVWGEKMFKAIKDNMDTAKAEGNLYQGFIGENL